MQFNSFIGIWTIIIHQIFSLLRDWCKTRHVTEYSPAKTVEYPSKQKPPFGRENMQGYSSADIISSSKFTVFLELRSRETVRLSEQIMSADKYPNIFSRQMETIVYLYHATQMC